MTFTPSTELEGEIYTVVKVMLQPIEAALLKLQVEVTEINNLLHPVSEEIAEAKVVSDDDGDYRISE